MAGGGVARSAELASRTGFGSSLARGTRAATNVEAATSAAGFHFMWPIRARRTSGAITLSCLNKQDS